MDDVVYDSGFWAGVLCAGIADTVRNQISMMIRLKSREALPDESDWHSLALAIRHWEGSIRDPGNRLTSARKLVVRDLKSFRDRAAILGESERIEAMLPAWPEEWGDPADYEEDDEVLVLTTS